MRATSRNTDQVEGDQVEGDQVEVANEGGASEEEEGDEGDAERRNQEKDGGEMSNVIEGEETHETSTPNFANDVVEVT